MRVVAAAAAVVTFSGTAGLVGGPRAVSPKTSRVRLTGTGVVVTARRDRRRRIGTVKINTITRPVFEEISYAGRE